MHKPFNVTDATNDVARRANPDATPNDKNQDASKTAGVDHPTQFDRENRTDRLAREKKEADERDAVAKQHANPASKDAHAKKH